MIIFSEINYLTMMIGFFLIYLAFKTLSIISIKVFLLFLGIFFTFGSVPINAEEMISLMDQHPLTTAAACIVFLALLQVIDWKWGLGAIKRAGKEQDY